MAPRFVLLSLAFVLALAAAVASGAGATGPARAEDAPPALLLPWEDGQAWLTGISGFHGPNDALDFFPPDTPLSMDLICEGQPGWYEAVSSYWVLAAAPGTVTAATDSLVVIDHGNGWSTGYYHMVDFQVQPGDHVQAGQRLAHPSTHGACTTGSHLHFWALGPGGQTTADVTLSGRAATDIGINEYITKTGNLPPEATPGPSPSPRLVPGDVNCDGAVDSLDALAVLRVSAGLPQQAGCMAAGDVDCNGTVDPADALAILRYAAGWHGELAECAPPAPIPTPEP